MILKTDRKSTINQEYFTKLNIKGVTFEEYKKVIEESNKEIAKQILINESGFQLPFNLGRLIILKGYPRVNKVYSATRPKNETIEIYNLHSFGYIYRFFHKEKLLMPYPYFWKFKPNRSYLKKPLYNIIHNGASIYLTTKEFNGFN